MSGYGLYKATGRWRNPLRTIQNKKCAMCGELATCAVLTFEIGAACIKHAKQAEKLGYDVIYPLSPVVEPAPENA